MASTRESKLKRVIAAKVRRQKLYDPTVFLSPARLDIAAKTIYARAHLEANTSQWPEYVYKEHIRAFNNFIEKEPRKTNYEEFKKSFINTIDSVRSDDS